MAKKRRRAKKMTPGGAQPRGRATHRASDNGGANAKPRKAFPMISRNDLKRITEQVAIYCSRASAATSDKSALIRTYAARKHLHPGAFALALRLYLMGMRDRGKLWIFLTYFDDIRTKLGLDQMAEEQGQLLPAIIEDERGLIEHQPQAELEHAGLERVEAHIEANQQQEAVEQPTPAEYPRPVEEQAGQGYGA